MLGLDWFFGVFRLIHILAGAFWAGTALDNGRQIVRLSWVPRPLVSAGAARPARVTAVATHGDTRVFEGAVESSGAAFPAPPGALKVTFTVEDSTKEIIDRAIALGK